MFLWRLSKIEVDIKKLQKLIKTYVLKQRPIFVHGAPGIGKSQSVRQVAEDIAKEKGLKYSEDNIGREWYSVMDLRISQLDPSDLKGIPFPDGDRSRWLVPSWLPSEGQGILFLDELNLAPPSIQSAAYQLILDRRLGDYRVPDGWSIVAAGNRASDKANVFPMSAPLKNRFSHATLMVPSVDDWSDWALENGLKTDIVAFLQFKPSFLFKMDAKGNADAFPTPRSWEVASAMTHGMNKTDEEFDLVATCVGEGVAHEYRGFLDLKRKVKLDEILKNPKKIKTLDSVGLKYSAISGLAEKYRGDKKLLDPVLNVVEELDPEFGIFLLRLLRSVRKDFQADLMKSKVWDRLYKNYGKYLL